MEHIEIKTILVIILNTSEGVLLIPPAAEMSIIVTLIDIIFDFSVFEEAEDIKLSLTKPSWITWSRLGFSFSQHYLMLLGQRNIIVHTIGSL